MNIFGKVTIAARSDALTLKNRASAGASGRFRNIIHAVRTMPPQASDDTGTGQTIFIGKAIQ